MFDLACHDGWCCRAERGKFVFVFVILLQAHALLKPCSAPVTNSCTPMEPRKWKTPQWLVHLIGLVRNKCHCHHQQGFRQIKKFKQLSWFLKKRDKPKQANTVLQVAEILPKRNSLHRTMKKTEKINRCGEKLRIRTRVTSSPSNLVQKGYFSPQFACLLLCFFPRWGSHFSPFPNLTPGFLETKNSLWYLRAKWNCSSGSLVVYNTTETFSDEDRKAWVSDVVPCPAQIVMSLLMDCCSFIVAYL